MFWGKINDDRTKYLSICEHGLAVAHVFYMLVQLPSIRRSLDVSANVNLSDVQLQRLATFALLHDFGKANYGFQRKPFNSQYIGVSHTREVYPLLDILVNDFANAIEYTVLASWFSNEADFESYLLAMLSHHGYLLRRDDLDHNTPSKWWGKNEINEIRNLLSLSKIAFPNAFESDVPFIPDSSELEHRFLGLLELADWLASDERIFSIDHPYGYPYQLDDIAIKAKAANLLQQVGLTPEKFQTELRKHGWTFETLFEFAPRPIQRLIETLRTDDPNNRLAILEDETGVGKTEAALMWYNMLMSEGKVDGLYFALPTRVAAKELYNRVFDMVQKAFPDEKNRPQVLLAVPGYAMADKTFPQYRENDDSNMRNWISEHPKRFLAGTIIVGTIDQVLLSAIQTKHAHMRSIGLDRLLLVVDEVHASDLYMNRLLNALLKHHIKRSYALLLSATLGSHAREGFLKTCGTPIHCSTYDEACEVPYPLIINMGNVQFIPESINTKSKMITVERMPYIQKLDEIVSLIENAVANKGRVLVMLNTKKRVRKLQRLVEKNPNIPKEALFTCNGVITPHHGGYSPSDRGILDNAVSDRFGKNSEDGPVVLIGTQTLEQSLDIDADLLITDLAPMDVLLQRMGRLHRHDRIRPEVFRHPKCVVLVPDCESLEVFIGEKGGIRSEAKRLGFGSVYGDLRILQLTWNWFKNHDIIDIPRENRRLVEYATHCDQLNTLNYGMWAVHEQQNYGKRRAQKGTAYYALIELCYDKHFGESECHFTDTQPKTRLGEGSVQLEVMINDQHPIGPFRQPIKNLVFPFYEIRVDGEEIGNERIEDLTVRNDELCFKVVNGNNTVVGEFIYTRFGLEKQEN